MMSGVCAVGVGKEMTAWPTCWGTSRGRGVWTKTWTAAALAFSPRNFSATRTAKAQTASRGAPCPTPSWRRTGIRARTAGESGPVRSSSRKCPSVPSGWPGPPRTSLASPSRGAVGRGEKMLIYFLLFISKNFIFVLDITVLRHYSSFKNKRGDKSMETHISVPIPTSQFMLLVDFLRGQESDLDPVVAVQSAIDYWLDNASWKPELLPPALSDAHGYNWKSVFLPHGTEIRMRYRSAYKYAKVEGDEVLYEGQPTTPGRLANAIAGSSRNAWRDLWIRRPGECEWTLADTLRPETQAVGDKLLKEIIGSD